VKDVQTISDVCVRDSGEIAMWPYAIDNKAQPIVKGIFIGTP